MAQFSNLPIDVLEEIFSYLTFKERFQCERVCRQWQQIIFFHINSVTFEGYDDVFHGFHKHVVNSKGQLPQIAETDTTVMKKILSKCHRSLFLYKGFVTCELMLQIAALFPTLHCIDVRIKDVKTLQILGQEYGQQLTCATLRVDFLCSIKSFISACPNLASLAVLLPCYDIIKLSHSSFVVDLFTTTEPHLPVYLKSLRNLTIEGNVTQQTLDQLELFTDLEMVSIVVTPIVCRSPKFASVLGRWADLKALSLAIRGRSCLHFPTFPPNLEYLSLQADGCPSSIDRGNNRIRLSGYLLQLKILNIYQHSMSSNDLGLILRSLATRCPQLETFSIGFTFEVSGNVDEELEPLLWFPSLKQLSLGSKFTISDSFAAKLMTDLLKLTSFGMCPSSFGCYSCEYLVPNGKKFWRTVEHKARSKSSDVFYFTGKLAQTLRINEPFPSNVFVILAGSAMIELGNGFGNTHHWQKLVSQWDQLSHLSLDIVDTSFTLSDLPKSVERLTINCLYEKNTFVEETLTFSTFLPKLKEFIFFQQIMNNSQLMAILQMISELCPKLTTLCVSRGNPAQDAVDKFINSVLQFQNLSRLCFGENIRVSDVFSAHIANEIKTLLHFGCGRKHHLGFECSSLFLQALVTKASRGQQHVVLNGGPSRAEVKNMLKPLKLPRLLRIVCYKKAIRAAATQPDSDSD